MKKRRRYYVLGYVTGLIYKVLSSTWRYNTYFPDKIQMLDFQTKNPEKSLLFAHWHGDEIALLGFCRRIKLLTFASKSKDGTIMAGALKSFGFHLIRGSSTRGGAAALSALLKKLRTENYYVSFAVDGPQGPRHKAKAGIHYVAYKSNLRIIQCIVDCKRKWRIPNTWNKAYVPKPFSRIDLCFFSVPAATRENRETVLEALNSRITCTAQNTCSCTAKL